MTKTYIGITVGPIGETMSLVTKPMALWAASYLFSYVSQELCKEICGLVGAQRVISPCVPEDEEQRRALFTRSNGVGLFHDHIIFRAEKPDGSAVSLQEVKILREQVICRAASVFMVEENYLKNYLLIAACEFTAENGENPILACSKQLDNLELAKPFVAREPGNVLVSAFTNKRIYSKEPDAATVGRNLGLDADSWQLIRNGNIRDIPSIAKASNAPGMKKNGYYCVLRADGDNMSKIIAQLRGEDADDLCRRFSQQCLDYCRSISEAIGAYGGMTVYAGGDDLLALVPCEGRIGDKRATVFSLVEYLDGKFNQYFCTYGGTLSTEEQPALSFGVLICNDSYPLYEALDTSDGLLFNVAKRNIPHKNCVAVQLRKHSGQTLELLLNKKTAEQTACAFRELAALLEQLVADGQKDANGYLLSAAQKLVLHEKLFSMASAHDPKNLFRNIFDADFHLQASRSGFLHDKLPNFYSKWCVTGAVSALENQVVKDNPVMALVAALRIMKFFVEKEGS